MLIRSIFCQPKVLIAALAAATLLLSACGPRSVIRPNPNPPSQDTSWPSENTGGGQTGQSGGQSGNETGAPDGEQTGPNAGSGDEDYWGSIFGSENGSGNTGEETMGPFPDQSTDPYEVAGGGSAETRNVAVRSLLDESEKLRRQGELAAAGSQLERALRIEPRNPWLSYRLANIRMQQGQARQAESFALKSIRLTEIATIDDGSKIRLKQLNWQLVADARRQRGDRAGANEAESRIRDYVI